MAKKNIMCIIPARIGSTRLPRKPLAMIGDKPMIQRTYEGAAHCTDIDRVMVATDSEEIKEVVEACGGTVVMTPENLMTGSDRVAFVAKEFPDADVVINLQGDEPFIKASMLSALLKPYIEGEDPDMATLAHPLDFDKAYQTPDFVKVLYDKQGYAIYFSRSPIPYFRNQTTDVPVLHHMGVYAFRSDVLQKYTQLPQTKLEVAESLEQLRALEHGYRIKVCEVPEGTLEINTPEELAQAQGLVA